MPTPILICRIAWMQDYRGLEGTIHSNAAYVEEHGTGGEIYNFLPGKTHVYGFVMFRGSMSIERLGADAHTQSVSPVDVVWTAPSSLGGVYVIGWYRKATVYRLRRNRPDRRRRRDQSGHIARFSISALNRNAHLLKEDDRWYQVPRRFVTQSMHTFLDGNSVAQRKLRQDLARLMAGQLKPPQNKRTPPRQLDRTKLLKAEQNAIAVVRKYYESKRYTVESVERDRVGWNLEAKRGDVVLHIEVKGCSGSEVAAELTPNEYAQSRAKAKKGSYRICIVTNALTSPKLHTFLWNDDVRGWTDQYRRKLTLQERVAAQVWLP